MKPDHKGLKKIVNSLKYSWHGLKICFQNEVAFRQELGALLLLTPIAIWLSNNAVEFILLIGSIFLLLVIELLNTAIEMVVDRQGSEWNELSGLAKDMGAAAVLVMICLCILIWGAIIIFPTNL